METPTAEVKQAATDSEPQFTHRDLIEQAYIGIAERKRKRDPAVSLNQAIDILARQLRVSRGAIHRMRTRNRVAPWHWRNIERITEGRVTEADFERARQG